MADQRDGIDVNEMKSVKLAFMTVKIKEMCKTRAFLRSVRKIMGQAFCLFRQVRDLPETGRSEWNFLTCLRETRGLCFLCPEGISRCRGFVLRSGMGICT